MVDCPSELIAIGKDVLVTLFAGPALSGGPAATQPKRSVTFNESASDRSLSNAAGTDENNGAVISGQGLETVQRVALALVLVCVDSRRSRHCA